MHQVVVGLVVQGQNSVIVGNDSVSLQGQLSSLGRIVLSLDLINQSVIIGVGIEQVVGRIAGLAQGQEAHGVHVVSAPAHGSNLIVAFLNVVIEDAPLVGGNFNIDVQVVLQHFSHSFNDLLDGVVVVVAQGQSGEAFAVGVASLCQGSLGALNVSGSGQAKAFAAFSDILAINRVAGGQEAVSGLCIDLHNVVDDGLTVDGQADCLADQNVVHRLGRAVEVIVNSAVAGAGLHTGILGLQAGKVRGRNAGNAVNLAGLVSGQSSCLIQNVAEGDLLQGDILSIPVVLVLFQNDVFVHAHAGDLEGAVADIGICFGGPLVAVGFNGGFLNRGEGPHAQDVDEIGGGLDQGDLQGLVVQSLHAQVVSGGGAVVILLSILDVIGSHADVLCGGGRGQNALNGVNVIFSGQVAAIAPLQAVAQVEGVGQAVVADIPAFSVAGNQGAGAVIGNKAFEAVDQNILCEGVVGHARIQAVGNVAQNKGQFLGGITGRLGGSGGGSCFAAGSRRNIGDVLGLIGSAAGAEQGDRQRAGKSGTDDFLFHVYPPRKENNVCLPFLCTGRAQQTGQGSQNGTAPCCISRFGRRYPFAAGCRNKKRRNQNKKA